MSDTDALADGITAADEPFGIANEFAQVAVRRVQTRAGERLEIAAPKTGQRILLDAVALEALTTQTPQAVSRILEASLEDAGKD